MKNILLICLVSFVVPIGHAADDAQMIKEKALRELASNHRLAEINLGKKFVARFERQHAGYNISAYCIGSFRQEGAYEYLLGIVNPANGEGEYVALLGDTNTRIGKFSLAPTWQENLPEVKCFSAMEAKRLNTTLQNSESISGRINPPHYFDVACVAPYTSHNAFTCYAYSASTVVSLVQEDGKISNSGQIVFWSAPSEEAKKQNLYWCDADCRSMSLRCRMRRNRQPGSSEMTCIRGI